MAEKERKLNGGDAARKHWKERMLTNGTALKHGKERKISDGATGKHGYVHVCCCTQHSHCIFI